MLAQQARRPPPETHRSEARCERRWSAVELPINNHAYYGTVNSQVVQDNSPDTFNE